MHHFTINSTYRQFYVADAGLAPDAPVDWTEDHMIQRHNTLKNITALCPEGDITARIFIVGPDEKNPTIFEKPAFEVLTEIEVKSGRLAVLQWPWDLLKEFVVSPGIYQILFRGYALTEVENEKDFYGVLITRKET